MTQKTIYKRAKRKFDMAIIAKRIKKRLRKKHKKTVSKLKIRKVWKDIVEIMIVKPLIEDGIVKVDNHLILEITADRLINKPALTKLIVEQKVKGSLLKNITDNPNPIRRGLMYGIEMKDDRYKTKIYFEPNKDIKKRLNEVLENTSKQYRINEPEQVNKH